MQIVYILIILTLLIGNNCIGQNLDNWMGQHKGRLKITNINGTESYHNMALNIEQISDSSYHWQIIYSSDSTQDIRNYILKKTSLDDHFIIDEQNTILLDLNKINNSFYSVFEINNNLMFIEYRLSGKDIEFILLSSGGKTSSGDNMHQGYKIPLVHSYKATSKQYALLKKDN